MITRHCFFVLELMVIGYDILYFVTKSADVWFCAVLGVFAVFVAVYAPNVVHKFLTQPVKSVGENADGGAEEDSKDKKDAA